MEKSLNGKKLLSLTKGLAGFTGILLVLFVIFSCNNILITSGGSLIISTPGARAASDSISYTIVVEGSKGSTQSKPLTGGTTVQFDDLAPDTYTISVEGKNKDDAVVLYGTDSATVEAGKTASADVELKKGASDFASLESAIAAGGTVYIFESIDVEKTLSISTDVSVIILPAYQDVTLKNTGDVVMFDVSAGNLTIGGGEHTITLDGNTFSKHAINIKSIGEVTLSSNAVIMNCGTASVKLQNTNYNSTFALFFLEGGTIKDNNGSGVEVRDGGKFTMNSGYIKDNNTSDGGGVYLNGGYLYLNGGSITGNNANGSGGGIYLSNAYLYMNGGSITDNTSTGSGGGIYSAYKIIMTGGVIEGNSTSGSGNGVYSGNSTQFSMGNSAVIDKNNDVYLMSSITISVTSELTGDSPVATITPYTYPDDTTQVQVLSLGNFTSAASKFAVTPNPADGSQWFINTDGNLQEGVSDFAGLQAAVAAGGTVYVLKSIDVETTLSISNTVIIVPAYQDVTLKNTSSGNLFTVGAGNLTIGGGNHIITLDGNQSTSPIISMSGGMATLADNGIIRNAAAEGVSSSSGTFNMTGGTIEKNTKGVNIQGGGTFTMTGGKITGNNGSSYGIGVTISDGTFKMEGGEISNNTTSHYYGGGVAITSSKGTFNFSGGSITGNVANSAGNGVYVMGGPFEMSGSAVVASNNDVHLVSSKITVEGTLSGTTPVATITPVSYAASTQVLYSADAFTLAAAASKFAVTPDTDGKKWTIDASGNLKEQ